MKYYKPLFLNRVLALALVASVVLSACTTDEAEKASTDAQQLPAGVDTLEISVQMNEFAFIPDTLRLPVDQPVRLTFENTGTVLHEFMAGKTLNPESNGFHEGLFADMDLHMDQESLDSHGMTGAGHDMNSPDPTGHMTMLLVGPGAASTMTFTLPSSRLGTWEMTCFQPGHFQSGMRGVILVQ